MKNKINQARLKRHEELILLQIEGKLSKLDRIELKYLNRKLKHIKNKKK